MNDRDALTAYAASFVDELAQNQMKACGRESWFTFHTICFD